MSSFNTTYLGTFGNERLAIFRFTGFWNLDDLSWLTGSHGFNHASTDHLLIAAPTIQQLVRDDFLQENIPITTYGSVMPIADREYFRMISAARISKSNIEYLRVPLYEGVSGWGFLVCMPNTTSSLTLR